MNKDQVSVELKKIFIKIFKIKKNISNISYNNNENWDSIRHIELIQEIEKRFNFSFEISETLKLNSFKSLEKFIIKKMC